MANTQFGSGQTSLSQTDNATPALSASTFAMQSTLSLNSSCTSNAIPNTPKAVTSRLSSSQSRRPTHSNSGSAQHSQAHRILRTPTTYNAPNNQIPQFESASNYQVSQLMWILTRVEQKVDEVKQIVVNLEEKLENTCPSSFADVPLHQSVSEIVSSPFIVAEDISGQSVSMASSVADDSSSFYSGSVALDDDAILEIKNQSRSPGNFAVRLIRLFFHPAELVSRNVSGTRGKLQLDTVRVERVLDLVSKFYPAAPGERSHLHKSCRIAIDAYLRTLTRT